METAGNTESLLTFSLRAESVKFLGSFHLPPRHITPPPFADPGKWISVLGGKESAE